MLDHVNKVKALVDQLVCLEVPVRDEDIVMTLLESLPASFEYLITAMETMPMKELTMDYVTMRLMHEMSKRKEKEPQGEDVAMVLRQNKGDNSFPRQGAKSCFYCGKPGHIARFCYKAKNKEQEQTKNAKDDDDYTFVMRNETHSKSMCKWIMDSGASKHMTLHKAAFDTYEVITPRNVHLDDNNVVQAIGMESIVVEAILEGKINQIHIKDMLHVSKLHANLLSVSKLVSNDLKIQFNLNECIVKSCNGEAIAIAPRKRNLYEINFVKVHEAEATNLVQSPTGDGALELWHRCLGHLNVKGVHTLQNMVSGMNLGKFSCPTSSLFCEACIEGKQHRVAFSNEGGGERPNLWKSCILTCVAS